METLSAPPITWSLVRIHPSVEMMRPDPCPESGKSEEYGSGQMEDPELLLRCVIPGLLGARANRFLRSYRDHGGFQLLRDSHERILQKVEAARLPDFSVQPLSRQEKTPPGRGWMIPVNGGRTSITKL